MDDWQLIQDYVERNSQSAFGILVERHLNLVYAVALRQTRDAHLAEEVAQAVFILLARKAHGFRSGIILPGWLFRTARFVASRAIRTEHRRLQREKAALPMQQLTTPDDAWNQMSPTIDEALEKLGETDRNAVLLRFFNDKSLRETANALGVSEDAAKKRVARAVEKLRGFFASRGFVLSTAIIGAALVANAAKAAPAGLTYSVTTAAMTASGATATIALPDLVGKTLAAWRWAKIKLAAGFGLGLAASLLTFHALVFPSDRQPAQSSALATSQVGAVTDSPPRAGDDGRSGKEITSSTTNAKGSLLFRVVDAETKTGIAGARICVSYVQQTKWWDGVDQTTDTRGECTISIPEGLGRLDVGALKDGYVEKFYTWRTDQDASMPPIYEIKLEHGVAIGGWVRNESGQMISGAEILVSFMGTGDSSAREPVPVRPGFLHELVAAKTDARGWWQCSITPPDYSDFSLEIRHPQYATATFHIAGNHRGSSSPQDVSMKDLWAGNSILVLQPGFQISGTVVDETDRPLADASVGLFVNSDFERTSTKTKTDGTFALGGLEPGVVRLNAAADGFAPANQILTINSESAASPVVLRLRRGVAVSLRVVDEQGEAVSGAWVVAESSERHVGNWWSTSDTNGQVRIEGIPDGVQNELLFTAGAGEFFLSRNVRLDATNPEPTLPLRRALKVSGSVVDAETGRPIESFKAIPCQSVGEAGYDFGERKLGTNGNFTVTFHEFNPPFRVRIEADGYEPAISEILPLDPRESSINLKLQRQSLSRAIRGTVLMPDGQPAAGAEVGLLTFEQGVLLSDGHLKSQGRRKQIIRTDSDGRFQFDPDQAAHTIVAANEAGFGRARIRSQDGDLTLRLSPWGKIEGRVQTRDGKWSSLDLVVMSPYDEAGLAIDERAKSDAEGHFSFDQLPAGNLLVYLNPGIGKSFTHGTSVEVRAGETVQAQIGGIGATVIGHLQIEGSQSANWEKQIMRAFLRPDSRPSPLPPVFDGSTLEERRKHLDLTESDAARQWARAQRPSVTVEVAEDGSFVAEGVRAGKYELWIEAAATPADRMNIVKSLSRPTAASLRQAVTISEAQEQAMDTINLEQLTLKSKATPTQ